LNQNAYVYVCIRTSQKTLVVQELYESGNA
jgi:hypothetical protein